MKKMIVIGNGMVGHRFCQQLLETTIGNVYEVTIFGEEPRVAYDRVYLSSYFEDFHADKLSLAEEGFYDQAPFDLRLNQQVVAIDRQQQTVTTQTGETWPYDHLILATGSYPFVPPIKGHDLDQCYVYRTIEDLDNIAACAKHSQSGVVIGGGLLGLEAAKALSDLHIKTHVVEFAPRLMPVQLDDGGALELKRQIEALGIGVHTSKTTTLINDGESTKYRLNFADDSHLDVDMVVFSAGIRPRDELAKQAGLNVGERGGIVINDHCQTSDPNIYAIGECALHNGMIYGLVAPGYAMSQVVVDQLSGSTTSTFKGADMSTKLKLMGVDVASLGDPHLVGDEVQSVTYADEQQGTYKKLITSDDGKHLLGGVFVGDADDFGTLLQFKLNDMDLPGSAASLILPSKDGAPALGADALPDTAQICSCYDVTKGDIHAAIDGGAMTMADIKEKTQACTGCGGCVQLTANVLNAELNKRGVEVNTDLCEHFPYTRQELYHLIKVEGHKTFASLLVAHGTGKGCDICKPTVASILGSVWNAYAFEKEHIPLQDTNDRYLGNMQKDGTYSVIPRVPGGEITPDKLIVLGEVAKDYQLYTKINGGQRIVLFGAKLPDLPDIWSRLIDAGFESGQAYAKSLRTVKSCVGSTWCRFGVDDSVTMAITLENRYKGVRSPHKMKMGASGCTRECAEAQAKDVGVIATENGWNLYVCGNGGMKPRHADLFATDLDSETLIRYVDRFIMFYIKTADRLQRTASWLESLEGGIDYLREVVIEDSLGIATELESHMAELVASYECDWKRAVDDPDKRKQFYHFVNSDAKDPTQLFVRERGQLRPATAQEKLDGLAVEWV